MYVSYVPGIPTTWNYSRNILHYTASNLWDWKFESKLSLSSDRVIDACIFFIKIASFLYRLVITKEVIFLLELNIVPRFPQYFSKALSGSLVSFEAQ